MSGRRHPLHAHHGHDDGDALHDGPVPADDAAPTAVPQQDAGLEDLGVEEGDRGDDEGQRGRDEVGRAQGAPRGRGQRGEGVVVTPITGYQAAQRICRAVPARRAQVAASTRA